MKETKKKTVKKHAKKTTKKSVKKENKSKLSKKAHKKAKNDFFNTEYILLCIFIILLLVVIGLGYKIYQKNKEMKKEDNCNVLFPIYKDRGNMTLSVNAKDLSNAGGYVIKVTNYKGDKINKKDVNYNLKIENKTNLKLKMYKDNTDKDLINGNEVVEVNNKLEKNVKKKDYYTIIVDGREKVKNNEKIVLMISS